MSAAIFEVNSQRYVSQKGIGLYPTSGTARDWFYSEEANELNEHRSAGYTMELRDTGQFGFLLPPEQVSISLQQESTGNIRCFVVCCLFVCLFLGYSPSLGSPQ